MDIKQSIDILKEHKEKDIDNYLFENNNYGELSRISVAIETVLNELDNSIPKSKIEDKIKELEKRMKEERKKTERKSKYLVTQEYMYRTSGLKELLEEE